MPVTITYEFVQQLMEQNALLLKQNENLTGIRFSMANYREQEKMVNVPLALVEEYFKTLKNEKIKI